MFKRYARAYPLRQVCPSLNEIHVKCAKLGTKRIETILIFIVVPDYLTDHGWYSVSMSILVAIENDTHSNLGYQQSMVHVDMVFNTHYFCYQHSVIQA